MADLAKGYESERTMFRPSRTNYPGSRFGPKTRYDLPQRHKAYGNADEIEAILFSGTSLQPQVWGTAAGESTGVISSGLSNSGNSGQTSGGGESTPRVLSTAGRSLLSQTADQTLAELPLINERNDVHGVLVLGGKGCGKTSFVFSLLASLNGAYPGLQNKEMMQKKKEMPAYGQSYELPSERDVHFLSGTTTPMRIMLTDTLPCGTKKGEEQPLSASVSPNSTQHYNAIPSWMRITLRSGNLPHYAVLFLIDATATPLWEDHQRCRELARLLSVLKHSQYTVVLGVTKLYQVREDRLKQAAYGVEHGKEVGKDPRSSYEGFVSRYIDKVSASIQAKTTENGWSFSKDDEAQVFPLPGVTIFDVPTWSSVLDYQAWAARRGTPELPNFKYANSQLIRLINALCKRSNPE